MSPALAALKARVLRWLAAVRRRLSPPRVFFLYHGDYAWPDNELADSRRGEKILGYLKQEGLLRPGQLIRPEPICMEALARSHDFDYLASLDDPAELLRIFGAASEHVEPGEILSVQRAMTGGTVTAARLARAAGPGEGPFINLGGGLHHASRGAGGGFCLLNDIAVAIHSLRAEGFGEPILVIDLDLHQGDGTRAVFADDPSVYTFSLHAVTWDKSPAIADRDVALGPGVADAAYRAALSRHLTELFDEFDPAFVFYVAGVDGAIDDALGHWSLSDESIAWRDQKVIAACGERPLVWTLAGGYGSEAWRHSARSFAVLLGSPDREIPSSADRALAAFRDIRADLGEQLTDLSSSDDFALTEADLYGDLLGAPSGRLLDYYSAHGVEVALERYGVLPKLRARGYHGFGFSLEADGSGGQICRLRGGDEPGELLIEASLRITTELAPHRLLAIDWLLLQDPRQQRFSRPLLPGQEHPGLGCLSEIVLMLSMTCERLSLDGLFLTPAHYHVARLGRAYMTFLDPELEAHFRLIAVALEGFPLAEASALVESGSLRDQAGEPALWRTGPMVMPVSEAFKARLSGEHAAAVEAASLGRSIRLVRS